MSASEMEFGNRFVEGSIKVKAGEKKKKAQNMFKISML